MAKCIKQFRFYGNGNEKNYPADLTAEQLRSGTAFKIYSPITQLGIQSELGMKFSVNGSSSIEIGRTGIYELDLEGLSIITDLNFDAVSLDEIRKYNEDTVQEGLKGLIVDIIYESAGI